MFQISVYFAREHFKTAVPLVITALLVMYTLQGNIIAKLPVTAYIKLIDVWMLYGLIMPFIILLLVVLIEHLPENHQVKFSNLTIGNYIHSIIFMDDS